MYCTNNPVIYYDSDGFAKKAFSLDNYKIPYYSGKSRPKYVPGLVDDVWNSAPRNNKGNVYNPMNPEIELFWKKDQSRYSQWHMGHLTGEEYRDLHADYVRDIEQLIEDLQKNENVLTDDTMKDILQSRVDEFKSEVNNAKHYAPESPDINMSHENEAKKRKRMVVKVNNMIKDEIARLLRKSNAMSDSKRNLQLLEAIIISEGWDNVPINGIYGSSDRTMLHLAVQADTNGNFIDVITFLVKNGINVNAKDSRGNTVLHYLSSENSDCTDSQYKIAKIILDNGGDLNILNNKKVSALRLTVSHLSDDYRLMRLFMEYKISEEVLDDLEKTANIIGDSQVIEIISQKRNCIADSIMLGNI